MFTIDAYAVLPKQMSLDDVMVMRMVNLICTIPIGSRVGIRTNEVNTFSSVYGVLGHFLNVGISPIFQKYV